MNKNKIIAIVGTKLELTSAIDVRKSLATKPEIVNGYETIAKTTKYGLVKIHDSYRVENYKGMYKKEVLYVEIPKELAGEFTDYLLYYKENDITKAEGKLAFDEYCDKMFDEEHTELYPESVK